MPMSLGTRLKHSWNAFFNKDPTTNYMGASYGTSYFPGRRRLFIRNERSIVTSVYNRIAMDVAAIDFEHVKLDSSGRFSDTVADGLNNCLTCEANIDQTSQAFFIDLVMSMIDEGVVAVVPVDTTVNPFKSGGFDVLSLRVGRIVSWYPEYVRIRLYNDIIGKEQEVTLPKRMVGIIENPLYSVMNEPNSTLQRLIRKLNLLDYVDEQSSSGKLDLIIGLPYVVKTPSQKERAEERRKDIEMQLSGSKYGIAYTDGTEKITQLNRSVENNIWGEVKDLTSMLYNQLGLTESIFNGTADERTMINYYNRTIDPFCKAIQLELQRKFLTKTARTQGHAIRYFRDPFRLVPVSELADIADKFTRNEIASSNEMRTEIGWKPVNDPKADELRNKNLNESTDAPPAPNTQQTEESNESANGGIDRVINQLADILQRQRGDANQNEQ